MLLQTNSYVVPKERRAEHGRLMRRFREIMNRIGCDDFEVYEQAGPDWGTQNQGQPTNRFVQIMRFRDRKHQLAVQAAERSEPAAQQVIAEFCELVNFPYQQERGLFVVGFYTSAIPAAPAKGTADAGAAADDAGQAAAVAGAAAATGADEEFAAGPAAEEALADDAAPETPSDAEGWADDAPASHAAPIEGEVVEDGITEPEPAGDVEADERGEQGGYIDETVEGPYAIDTYAPEPGSVGTEQLATEELPAEDAAPGGHALDDELDALGIGEADPLGSPAGADDLDFAAEDAHPNLAHPAGELPHPNADPVSDSFDDLEGLGLSDEMTLDLASRIDKDAPPTSPDRNGGHRPNGSHQGPTGDKHGR